MCNNARSNLCKKMLYYGRTLFGRATDDPQSLAKTVLGVMIFCMFGRPTLMFKMQPIAKLNLPFPSEQIRLTIDASCILRWQYK